MDHIKDVLEFIRTRLGGPDDLPIADLEVESIRVNGRSRVTVRPAEGKTFRFEVEVDPDALAKREDLPSGGVTFTSRIPLKVEMGDEMSEADLVRVRLVPCPSGAPHDHVVVDAPKDTTVCTMEVDATPIMSVVPIAIGGAGDEEADLEALMAEAEAAYDAAGWPSEPETD